MSDPSLIWTTRDQLLLCQAVLSHGNDNFSAISRILRSKTYQDDVKVFNAKVCATKYEEIINSSTAGDKRRKTETKVASSALGMVVMEMVLCQGTSGELFQEITEQLRVERLLEIKNILGDLEHDAEEVLATYNAIKNGTYDQDLNTAIAKANSLTSKYEKNSCLAVGAVKRVVPEVPFEPVIVPNIPVVNPPVNIQIHVPPVQAHVPPVHIQVPAIVQQSLPPIAVTPASTRRENRKRPKDDEMTVPIVLAPLTIPTTPMGALNSPLASAPTSEIGAAAIARRKTDKRVKRDDSEDPEHYEQQQGDPDNCPNPSPAIKTCYQIWHRIADTRVRERYDDDDDQQAALPYLVPVNEAYAPNYTSIIKHPMDLGTIKSRMDRCELNDHKTFVDLMSLVFDNAMIYNSETSPFHKTAKKLKEIFTVESAKLSQFEEKPAPPQMPANTEGKHRVICRISTTAARLMGTRRTSQRPKMGIIGRKTKGGDGGQIAEDEDVVVD